MRNTFVVLVFGLALSVSACGTKGPLVLPKPPGEMPAKSSSLLIDDSSRARHS